MPPDSKMRSKICPFISTPDTRVFCYGSLCQAAVTLPVNGNEGGVMGCRLIDTTAPDRVEDDTR
jgi:hypothetical protein